MAVRTPPATTPRPRLDQRQQQEGARVTAGTTSIRAVPDGVIIRQGSAEVKIWKHQLLTFTDFAVDWFEQLERRSEQEDEEQ